MKKLTPRRYLDLNSFLRARFRERVQKISVDAGLTCPNRDGTVGRGGCIYCNARGAGTGAHGRGMSITRQLQIGKKFLGRRYKARKFIAYFQSFSNTYASPETLDKIYGEALAVPGVVGLAIGTRPDCVDGGILDLLAGYARKCLVWMEYGLQSAHDATLVRINRGHSVAAFTRAARRTRQRNILVCAHVILGLPGETREQMLATADYIAALGIHSVKLHFLYVIKGTALEGRYRAGRYRCLTQDQYVALACQFIERLPPGMVIQRITGDPHPEELVAPPWAIGKSATRNLITEQLALRNTWQGRRFGTGGW